MDRPPEPEDSLCHRLRGKGGTKYQRGNGWWCRNGAAPRPGFRRFKRFCPLAAGRFRGCGIVLWDDKFYMPLRGIKTIQPGCARGKCTPSAYGTSPGGGGLLSASLSANLSHSLLSAAKTSPSGGSTAAGGDRGAFPTPAGRLYGLSATDRRHLYWRPRGANLHLPFTIYPKLLRRLTSDCLIACLLPTDWYSAPFSLLTTLTEILRLRSG